MPFSKREYYSLTCLEQRWQKQITHDDLIYAIETGNLRASCWLPWHVVERSIQNGDQSVIQATEPFQGWVVVRPTDCSLIFRRGKASIRRFLSLTNSDHIIRLANEPIKVHSNDLRVLHDDRCQFEQQHNLHSAEGMCKRCIQLYGGKNIHTEEKPKLSFIPSNNYQQIVAGNKSYSFGSVQAKVVRHLHQAKEAGDPWVHGKILLHESGSQGQRLRDVFKHQKNWQNLIGSDGKGYYRLNIFE